MRYSVIQPISVMISPSGAMLDDGRLTAGFVILLLSGESVEGFLAATNLVWLAT